MLTKKIVLLGACCLAFLTISFQQEATALPAYARQTGFSCSACHFQRFPLLNSFGRLFKANGYTLVGGKQGTIEDSNLSIPASLNAAFVSKFKYQKRNGSATTDDDAGQLNTGQFQVPDEAILYVAGRVAKNIGFEAEINLAGTVNLAGFKMPFVFPATDDLTFSVIPFITDSEGPAYGFELLNTGALEFSRSFEHAEETSAQQYLGTALSSEGQGTTGVALVAYSKMGYLSYTPFIPRYPLEGNTFSPNQFLSYVRGVVTPNKVGNFDLAAGFQLWKGNSRTGPADARVVNHADAWALDAQAQGKAGKYPLGVYLTYGTASKTLPGEQPNIFNDHAANKTAWTVAADLGIIPSKLALGAAYRNAHSGDGGNDAENAITLAVTYNPVKNIAFQLNHSFYSYDASLASEGNQHTTLVMFSAF